MLMPIVSMNKMAMNESVAATCCYREQVSATNVYWEVLHGGWIGSGYVKTKTNSVDNRSKWQNLFPAIDVSVASPLDYSDFPEITRVDPIGPDAGPTTYTYEFPGFTSTYTNALGLLYDENSPISKIKDCDHKDGTCAYFNEDAVWTSNQHWEATSKHAGVDAWSEPHGVSQWTS